MTKISSCRPRVTLYTWRTQNIILTAGFVGGILTNIILQTAFDQFALKSIAIAGRGHLPPVDRFSPGKNISG